MPCDSGQGMSSDGDLYRRIDGLKRECDEVTSMLCSLLRSLDERIHLPPEIVDWYRKHKEYDKSQGR